LPESGSRPPKQKFLELAQKTYNCEPAEAWQGWPQPPAGIVRYLVQPETEQATAFWLKVVTLHSLPLSPEATQMISLIDVTEQMRTQRSIWTFHSAVDHKLRTPTTFITGAMEMLKNDLDDDEKHALLNLFAKGVHRLQQALEDVLQYVDMSARPRGDAGFPLADLPALAAKISEDLDISAAAVDVADPALALRLPLTPLAMERIVWELMENAKKFHPQRSPLVAWQVTAVNDNHVLIQVSDDGRTLSPDQLTQIWAPYYQAEKYFTGQTEGMGLGLSLVANLVWSVGGRCQVVNRSDGPGIRVELYLPTG
jgi:K+-sensing histidine kinase KdpD